MQGGTGPLARRCAHLVAAQQPPDVLPQQAARQPPSVLPHVNEVVRPHLAQARRQLAHQVLRRRLGQSLDGAQQVGQVAAGAVLHDEVEPVRLLLVGLRATHTDEGGVANGKLTVLHDQIQPVRLLWG